MRLAYSASNFPPPGAPPPLLGPGAWPRGVRQSEAVHGERGRRSQRRQRTGNQRKEEKTRRTSSHVSDGAEKAEKASVGAGKGKKEIMSRLTRSCGLKRGHKEVGRSARALSRREEEGRRDEQVIPAEKFRCSGQSHFCRRDR